ncbi:hypothetical protein TKK_0010200 [Trichogramma kaykai]
MMSLTTNFAHLVQVLDVLGRKPNLLIMKEFDVHPGVQAINFAIEADRKRTYSSDYQQASSSTEARTERRKRLHSPNDNSYIPGGH